MGTTSGEIQIDKPVADVYRYIINTANWPKMEAEVVSVTPMGVVKKGMKGTEVRKMGKRTVDGSWEITELEQDKKLTMAWGGKGISGTATDMLTASGNGTKLTFQMDYKTKGLMMMLMGPMISMQFKKTTKAMMPRMKSAIEGNGK